jgi:glutathione S-transferase
MKLRYSPTSPYVRKVLVTALETGLESRIERITTDPWSVDVGLLHENPLSKVPTLVADDGLVLYDSPVICEYLDGLHRGRPLIPGGAGRWTVLRLQALGDGILDAAVLLRLEAMRPEQERSEHWQVVQQTTVDRGLDALEVEVADWPVEPDLGQITAACALGYLDFRFAERNWRASHAKLAEWYAAFAQRPSVDATRPPN